MKRKSFNIGDTVICHNVPTNYARDFHTMVRRYMTIKTERVFGVSKSYETHELPGCWWGADKLTLVSSSIDGDAMVQGIQEKKVETIPVSSGKNFSLPCTCPRHMISLGCPRVSGGKCRG